MFRDFRFVEARPTRGVWRRMTGRQYCRSDERCWRKGRLLQDRDHFPVQFPHQAQAVKQDEDETHDCADLDHQQKSVQEAFAPRAAAGNFQLILHNPTVPAIQVRVFDIRRHHNHPPGAPVALQPVLARIAALLHQQPAQLLHRKVLRQFPGRHEGF